DAVVNRNRSNGEGFLLPEILRLRARQLDALDRHTEAAADRKEAVQLAQQQGARPILLRVLMDVIQTEDRPDPALRDLLRTTADGYDDRLNLADVTAARRLLATELFVLDGKADLDGHLPVSHLPILDVPSRGEHFEPPHVVHGLARSRERGFHAIL